MPEHDRSTAAKTPDEDPRGQPTDATAREVADMARGCPVCDWRGKVAQTHDRTHNYYTHIIIRGNQIFRGDTCIGRTQPRDPGPLTRLWRWWHA